jgi:hypothetical protein
MRPDTYRLVGTLSHRIRQSQQLVRIVESIELQPNELYYVHNTNQAEVVVTIDIMRFSFGARRHGHLIPIEQWPAWVDTLHTLLSIHHPDLRTP